MNETAIHALARRAGIAIDWRDYANRPQRVSTESLVHILGALGLPCGSPAELSDSEQLLNDDGVPPLVTATVGEPIDLPMASRHLSGTARLMLEEGGVADLALRAGPRGRRLPAVDTPGYHRLEIGAHCLTLAVAPARCVTVADVAPNERLWGVAAQIYGLRSPGDCGIGDGSGVAALAKQAAAHKADVLALSPVHALFTADPRHSSPYSPSSRLFYNPLHADAQPLFGDARVAKALADSGMTALAEQSEPRDLVDWPQSAHVKLTMFRRLFDDFCSSERAQPTPLTDDFTQFRTRGGALLEDHARFEALHAEQLRTDPAAWSWANWPVPLRDPTSDAVKTFAARNDREIEFHVFLQWLADRSLAAAQREAKQAGMRIGLLADLAVGMSGAGSHAWTSQKDILVGLEVGAPADLYNTKGQKWGLTTFSPRALVQNGFAPFIATLRACLRHAGGVRIDHAMGLMRLWVVPRGADARDGAYLSYPIDDLLRLTALESQRHRAIVIGEDLGTVPAGFRERLDRTGIYGMRVLWFERKRNGFTPPQVWSADSAAMTSTHDLPTVAGWWRGTDIETRAPIGLADDAGAEQTSRESDRKFLWRALRRSKSASGDMPPPAEAAAVADAAVKFIAQTASRLRLLPLEDVLALEEQPNLPGTIDQHPNWRRRYPGQAETLLDGAETSRRLKPLTDRGSP